MNRSRSKKRITDDVTMKKSSARSSGVIVIIHSTGDVTETHSHRYLSGEPDLPSLPRAIGKVAPNDPGVEGSRPGIASRGETDGYSSIDVSFR